MPSDSRLNVRSFDTQQVSLPVRWGQEVCMSYNCRSSKTAGISYHHPDHLGNIMLAYSDLNGDGYIQPRDEVLEENRYFPYGLKQAPYTQQSTTLPFGYNGAEWKDNLGLHLTTYRTMAPEVAMWGQVDLKAEKIPGYSPYSSMGGNPISFAYPDGDEPITMLLIGMAVGGFSGFTIGKQQGATGWEMFGYIAAGAGNGALSAGVGSKVASGLGAVVPGQFGGGVATVAGSAVRGGISGGGFAALAEQIVGEGIWKGAVAGAVGGFTQGAVGGGFGAALVRAAAGATSAALYYRPIGPSALAGAATSYASYEISTALGYSSYRDSGKKFLSYKQFRAVSFAAQRSFFWGKEYGGWFLRDGGVEMWPRGTKDSILPTAMPQNAVEEFYTHPSTGNFFGRSYYPDHSPAEIWGFAGFGRSFVVERNNIYGLNSSVNSQIMFPTRRFNPYPFGLFLGRY